MLGFEMRSNHRGKQISDIISLLAPWGVERAAVACQARASHRHGKRKSRLARFFERARPRAL
jgi:hypothetical protein